MIDFEVCDCRGSMGGKIEVFVEAVEGRNLGGEINFRFLPAAASGIFS